MPYYICVMNAVEIIEGWIEFEAREVYCFMEYPCGDDLPWQD